MNGQKNVLLTVPQNQGNLQAEQLDIRGMIHIIRGQQVILDSDLALLYQVETKRLNERVKRNRSRFPESFCFQLTREENDELRSQSAISTEEHGGRRYLPYAYTEGGIAMLSAVLNSETAIEVSMPSHMDDHDRSFLSDMMPWSEAFKEYAAKEKAVLIQKYRLNTSDEPPLQTRCRSGPNKKASA